MFLSSLSNLSDTVLKLGLILCIALCYYLFNIMNLRDILLRDGFLYLIGDLLGLVPKLRYRQ